MNWQVLGHPKTKDISRIDSLKFTQEWQFPRLASPEDWLAPNFKFYPCVLCKMSYHRFVGAAILLLANVFHCADCVGNRIINDITCVKRKELGDGISQ